MPSGRKNGAVPASFTLRKTPMKFEDAPRLPKLPFIATDIALLAFAASIAALHPNPAAPVPLFIITACVLAGVVVLMIPFIANYGRDQEDAVKAQRHEVGEQIKLLTAASDRLQNSTIQLKSVEETATRNVEAAERLPYRMQERIAEFNQQLAASENKDKARLEEEVARMRSREDERLAAVADQITKALAEFSRIEDAARQSFAAMVQQEKELLGQQVAALQAAAAAQGAATLAEWTKIKEDARQNIAAMMRQEKELFEQQATTLRITDRENQTAAAAQIATALADFSKLEADARRSFTDTMQREKEFLEQQVVKLRSASSERLAAAAEEIAMTLASWTAIEAGMKRQLSTAIDLQGKLATVLSALNTRIADLRFAAEAAAKAADAVPSAPPPSPVVLPPPGPAEGLPIVAGPEPVKTTAATMSPSAVETVAAPPPVPDARPREAADPAAATAAGSSGAAGQAPEAAEAPPARGPDSAAGEAPAAPEPPSRTEAASGIAAAEVPPPPSAPEAAPPPAPSGSTPAPGAAGADLPSPEPDESELLAPSSDAADLVAPAKPRKPRAPKKPKLESAASSDSTAGLAPLAESTVAGPPPVELIAEPVAEEPPAPEDFSQLSPEESKPVATPSADGRTRLTVISYIGIGNKLHLRGEGAGLSPTKGVPLQFVSIGRWRWETDAASGPIVCRIYKNDKLEAPIGAITLLPGTEQEVSASF